MKLFSTMLAPIFAASSASASASLAGAGRSSGRSSRIDFGTAWEISVSTEGTPSVASMARVSARPGPIWRAAKAVGVLSVMVRSCSFSRSWAL